ncbi:MAG: hypothetical protein FJ104_02760, partial [Deltaproteobacteria bacterium]|nr:hypothetical protein [Deltaproteobacteria bacterium]
MRDPSVEVRVGVGTPRSLVARLATRFGRDPDSVALVAALSRALGLWDASAALGSSPPGSERVGQLDELLFRTWRRGGAWDDARPDGEALRTGIEARDASAAGVVRDLVLEALAELGDGRWVPWEVVAAFVRTDGRAAGVNRLLQRWAQRMGIETMTVGDLAHRIAFGSLHVLGAVDLGDVDDEEGFGPTLRLTPRGRRFLNLSEPAPSTLRPSVFLESQSLRVGGAARIAEVIAVAPITEIGAVTTHVDLIVSGQLIARTLAAGLDAQAQRARLEALAPIPDAVERLLVQASAVLGRAEYVQSQGFLWVDDPEVRELLRTRRQTADLFVDPSPPGGLLIAAGVELDRLSRRCRGLGVEVLIDGEPHGSRSSAPPRRISVTPSAPDVRPARTAS